MKHHSDAQKEALKKAAGSLYRALLAMREPEEVRSLLIDLCTPAELEAIVDRWWAACLLEKGMSYREISDATGVSVTTIGRVARFMEMGEGGYRLAISRGAAL